MRRLLLAICVLTMAEPALAQEARREDPTCRVYFAVVWQDSHIPGGWMFRMTKSQSDWYTKKGKTKYPGVCMDKERATYILVWSAEARSHTYTVPLYQQSTATITGDVNATAQVGTWSQSTQTARIDDVYMFVLNTNGRPFASGGTLNGTPIFVSEHEGRWRWSKPRKDAFEDAVKFLSTTETK
jgi:hypothetical protein